VCGGGVHVVVVVCTCCETLEVLRSGLQGMQGMQATLAKAKTSHFVLAYLPHEVCKRPPRGMQASQRTVCGSVGFT